MYQCRLIALIGYVNRGDGLNHCMAMEKVVSLPFVPFVGCKLRYANQHPDLWGDETHTFVAESVYWDLDNSRFDLWQDLEARDENEEQQKRNWFFVKWMMMHGWTVHYDLDI